MTKHNRPWQYLYNTSRWIKGRRIFLSRNPLCVYCEQAGKTTSATVVDHKIPHKGDVELFYDTGNFQPLCKPCHDSDKALEESRGYRPGNNADGMPVDGNHPWNKEEL